MLPRFGGKKNNGMKNTVRAESVIFLNPQIGGENFGRKSTRESPRSPFFSLSHLLHFLLGSKVLIDFSSICLSLPLRHPLFPSLEQSVRRKKIYNPYLSLPSRQEKSPRTNLLDFPLSLFFFSDNKNISSNGPRSEVITPSDH
jgi:hypothetical protein